MIDNGIFIFTHDERAAFLEIEPQAKPLFCNLIGGDEYINWFTRWILYLADADPAFLRTLPLVTDRLRELPSYRASSARPSTQAMAEYPTKLGVDERLQLDYLVIPNISSERRDYAPIGWLGTDMIASQKLRILPDASLWEFAILTSRAHMAWLGHIGGRLKSDFSYTRGLVYNTFPWPDTTPAQRAKLEVLAQAVLDARAAHPTSARCPPKNRHIPAPVRPLASNDVHGGPPAIGGHLRGKWRIMALTGTAAAPPQTPVPRWAPGPVKPECG